MYIWYQWVLDMRLSHILMPVLQSLLELDSVSGISLIDLSMFAFPIFELHFQCYTKPRFVCSFPHYQICWQFFFFFSTRWWIALLSLWPWWYWVVSFFQNILRIYMVQEIKYFEPWLDEAGDFLTVAFLIHWYVVNAHKLVSPSSRPSAIELGSYFIFDGVD